MSAAASPTSAYPFARTYAILLAGGAVAGAVAADLVTSGRSTIVLALGVAVVATALIWKAPALGPVLAVGAALTIEQFPLSAVNPIGATARIPLFHGLGGYRPSDLLLVMLLGIAVAGYGSAGLAETLRPPLGKAIACLFLAVLFAFAYGVRTGGVAAVAMNEARPFAYLAAAFVATAMLIRTRELVRPVLWAFVVCTGFKGVQGVLLFLPVRRLVPRPDAVLGHEESLFFALFVLLTLALWLCDVSGPLRTTATVLLPVVVAADLGNSRRIAWIVLPVGVLVEIAVGLVALKSRRRFLAWLTLGLAAVSLVYFPAYWGKTGGFAQPARAVRSAVSPSGPRDLSSNLYRTQEDANLRRDIGLVGPLGSGLGHRIEYALPIVDISDIDPYIVYVPHNGVWYLFLRFGAPGTVAFWSMLGIGIVTGCRLARRSEKELAAVGMVLAAALPAYAILGYGDQGFYYYRVAFVVGALLGLGEAARRLAAGGGLEAAAERGREEAP